MRVYILVAAALLGLAGCATAGLEPAPGAVRVIGQPNAAYGVASNVRITVRTQSWPGSPSDLDQVLTPVEVTIENGSGHPLAVRYGTFELLGARGFRYTAYPPLLAAERRGERSQGTLEGKARPALAEADDPAGGPIHAPSAISPAPPPPVPMAPPPAPAHAPAPAAPPAPPPAPAPAPAQPITPPSAIAPSPPPAHAPGIVSPPPAPGGHISEPIHPPPAIGGSGRSGIVVHPASPITHPHYHYHGFYVAPYYGVYYPWLTVWPGPLYWEPYYYGGYSSWPQSLPTRDMQELALPEGVLDNGGRVTGFLYFPSVKQESQVTFQAQLVDARTGQNIGTVGVPLLVTH